MCLEHFVSGSQTSYNTNHQLLPSRQTRTVMYHFHHYIPHSCFTSKSFTSLVFKTSLYARRISFKSRTIHVHACMTEFRIDRLNQINSGNPNAKYLKKNGLVLLARLFFLKHPVRTKTRCVVLFRIYFGFTDCGGTCK